jgi:long-chain acyl-CoA synthetase
VIHLARGVDTLRSRAAARAAGADQQPDPFDQAFAQLFLRRATDHADEVAFRHKDYGIWQEVTWREYRRHAELFALGLLELGATTGDPLAIMGDPIPEWLYADLAAQSIGMVPFGIYVTAPAEDIAYQMGHSGARIFVAEDQEYVDKLFESGYDDVDHIVVADARGMFAYTDSRLTTVAAVEELGADRLRREPELWEKLVGERSPDDPIAIFYTSGTTGRPKGALLSSRNLVCAWSGCFVDSAPPSHRDRTIAALPLAHLAERITSVYSPMLFGSVTHLPEDQDTSREATVESQPTLMIGLPRLWETFASQVLVDIELTSPLKRAVYRLGMKVRERYMASIYAERRPSILLSAANQLAMWTVFRPILDKFGYSQLRFTMVGGAPVSPEVIKLWQCWGVRILEIYGMTEAAGIISVPRGPVPQPGLAGKALPGIEITLDDEGEILISGPNVFLGYYNDPKATAEAVDERGYLHSGDIGILLPDGNLKVVDRKKDILTMADGATVPASQIEHQLKFSPYVRDAMLVGQGRTYLTALLELDFDITAEWARGHGITYTGFSNLAANPRIKKLVDDEVARANSALAEEGVPTVKDFRILNKELDPEASDEITATRKVKRRALAQKFSALVETMYPESDVPESPGPLQVSVDR